MKLESIVISTPPTKTNYKEGEKFDKSGMVITAKYSDGSSKVVTNYTYTPQTELKPTDTTITITYSENSISKSTSQKINVAKKVDGTEAPGILPHAGLSLKIVFALVLVLASCAFAYYKYNKIKEI